MSARPKVNFVLDTAIVLPGSEITGRFIVDVFGRSFSLTGAYVELIGKEFTHVTVGRGIRKITCPTSFTHVSIRRTVYGVSKDSAKEGCGVVLEPGHYDFPFSIQLPLDAPPTYGWDAYKCGSRLRYKLHGALSVPYCQSIHTERLVTVLPVVPYAQVAALQEQPQCYSALPVPVVRLMGLRKSKSEFAHVELQVCPAVVVLGGKMANLYYQEQRQLAAGARGQAVTGLQLGIAEDDDDDTDEEEAAMAKNKATDSDEAAANSAMSRNQNSGDDDDDDDAEDVNENKNDYRNSYTVAQVPNTRRGGGRQRVGFLGIGFVRRQIVSSIQSRRPQEEQQSQQQRPAVQQSRAQDLRAPCQCDPLTGKLLQLSGGGAAGQAPLRPNSNATQRAVSVRVTVQNSTKEAIYALTVSLRQVREARVLKLHRSDTVTLSTVTIELAAGRGCPAGETFTADVELPLPPNMHYYLNPTERRRGMGEKERRLPQPTLKTANFSCETFVEVTFPRNSLHKDKGRFPACVQVTEVVGAPGVATIAIPATFTKAIVDVE